MLFALGRLGASLKLCNAKGPPSSLLQLPRAHLPRSLFSIARPWAPGSRISSLSNTPRLDYGCFPSRPDNISTMFRQAVQNHNAVALTSPPKPVQKQSSLGTAFNRTDSSQRSATRPLANGVKHNGAGTQPAVGQLAHGVKRTSSGLAKSLSSQEDMIHYPSLNIVGLEKENNLPSTYFAGSGNNSGSLASALFDENDFDSDIDLDVEDPATKGTVSYPKLPSLTSPGVKSAKRDPQPQTSRTRVEPDSSQPIPWSSSPLEHSKTPQKLAQPRSKRSALPWLMNQPVQPIKEMVDEIESEEETIQPKKRKSAGAEQATSTPAPKSSNPQYLWNTTASALKQQQKNFREQSKAQSKAAQGADDDVKEAIKKKKKNTVHRIFLSEEQQNVLNLVTEHKKSVFFTGSAGKMRPSLLWKQS